MSEVTVTSNKLEILSAADELLTLKQAEIDRLKSQRLSIIAGSLIAFSLFLVSY